VMSNWNRLATARADRERASTGCRRATIGVAAACRLAARASRPALYQRHDTGCAVLVWRRRHWRRQGLYRRSVLNHVRISRGQADAPRANGPPYNANWCSPSHRAAEGSAGFTRHSPATARGRPALPRRPSAAASSVSDWALRLSLPGNPVMAVRLDCLADPA
jgi:hypothetical protein